MSNRSDKSSVDAATTLAGSRMRQRSPKPGFRSAKRSSAPGSVFLQSPISGAHGGKVASTGVSTVDFSRDLCHSHLVPAREWRTGGREIWPPGHASGDLDTRSEARAGWSTDWREGQS